MDEKIVTPTYSKKVLAGNPNLVKKEDPKPEPELDMDAEVEEKEAPETASEENIDTPEDQKVNPEAINPNEPLFHAVADYLNITDQRDYSDAVPKVQRIIEWVVKDIGSNSYEDVISRISELTHSIAKPDFEVKLYKHLYRYVTLKEQESSIKKALRAWEGKKINGN